MLNVIAIMGRLTAEPELRHTPNGVATCTFRIAVERSFARAGEERKADFIDIVTWRKTAEFVCKYFGKGSLIAVNGSLQTRSYEDKNGNRRTAYEVVADNVHFAGEKTESKPKPFGPATTPVDINSGPDDFAVIDSEEDLPF
jgi:single-strand binding protein|nr:MAG TPA: Single strand binding protein [Caudoviricetes sp.]